MSQGQDPDHAAEGGAASGEASRGDPALIGRTIAGKFVVEKFLGGGAMGAVYRARQTSLEKNVALKVMHRAIAVDPSFVARFHREAKAASRLDHPNSMRVIDFGEEPDGLLYIAMEYLDGRDLFRVIHEDWPLSNQRIADVVMQALAAIAVAHDMGVIHRDLKPENIMILRAKDDDGKDGADLVKVCDFGIAKITEKDDEAKPAGPAGQKLTTQGLVVGTPEYMSPEQAKGEKLDARSDIYSMAVILYQLLTGRTPFTADTPLAVVLKHITENPPPPREIYAGVHPGLEEVCLKGLTKDRNGRYQSARDMRNAIRAVIEGRPAPVDIAAATEVSLPSVGGALAAGTAPIVVSSQMTGPIAGAPASRAVATNAPTIAGAPGASSLTPLGTAAVAEPPKKSRTGLFMGLAAAVVLLGGGAIAATRILPNASLVVRDTSDRGTSNSAHVVATNVVPSATATGPTTTAPTAATVDTSTATPADPKTAKPAHLATAASAAKGKPVPGSPAGKGEDPPPPPPATAEPPPPPPTTTPPPTPPPATAAPPPPPPAPFNPAVCKAAVGAPKAATAISAKNLRLNSAPATFDACAKSSIREKPPGPLSATVRIMFSDTKAFKGATCNGCPPALAACVQRGARGASVILNDDAIDSAFDVPVTFSCD